jgi:hypothetical protein
MIWLAMSGLKQGPRGSLVGQLILGGAGVATFAVGVWLIVDLEKVKSSLKMFYLCYLSIYI